MTSFVLRAVISALGLWIATRWVPGIRIDDPGTLVLAGLLLGIVNAIVRPVVILLTLPLTLLTLGVFLLVVNAAMLALVAWMLPGFQLTGGFWSAFEAALIVWTAGWLASWLIGPKGRIQIHIHRD
ncbi:MAG: phage holin family protein [Steroidobacteraceae bacterium]